MSNVNTSLYLELEDKEILGLIAKSQNISVSTLLANSIVQFINSEQNKNVVDEFHNKNYQDALDKIKQYEDRKSKLSIVQDS